MRLATARPARLLLALVAAAVVLGGCVAQPAVPRTSTAQTVARLVGKRIAPIAPQRRHVACRRTGSRWTCAWRGERRLATGVRRCRGTYSVRRIRGHWRTHSVSRTCRSVPTSVAQPFPLGFNDNGVAQHVISAAADAQLTERVGATSSRIAFNWAGAEPSPGQYRLAVYDDIYRELTARGIRPLFILVYAPAWASNWTCDALLSDCRAQAPTPDHYADAGRMAALLARRYPRAAGIEVWNEPNLREFWGPSPDPAAYAGLLSEVHIAVDHAAPGMPVIGGGLGNGRPEGSIAAAQFLEGVYEAGGAPSMDAIGIHPYPFSATSLAITLRTLDEVRAVRDAHHDSARPLWVTELGTTTTGDTPPVSEGEQADILVSAYRALRAMPDVGAIYLHTLVEPPLGLGNAETGYGIVHDNLTPKPAFCALAAAWGRPHACS